MVSTHSLYSLIHTEIWAFVSKVHEGFLVKKQSGPHLYPWRAQNPDILIKHFHYIKKIIVFIIKTILENNGADHIAGSTAQDKSGITR